MKFSIITPTFKRPELLIRAVESVFNQDYSNWEMIIVNDSPQHDYSFFENRKEFLTDKRIKYLKNSENKGVNSSRNFALQNIASNSCYTIFLDDDDCLNLNALQNLEKEITNYPNKNWYISKRVFPNNEDITKIPFFYKNYSYVKDVLLTKKIKNDFTAIVNSELIQEKNIRYSIYIKQAEELIFWHHLNFYTKAFSLPLPTTLSYGYLSDGLTKNKDSKYQRIKQTFVLFKEAEERGILNLEFILYLILRVGAILIK